MTTFANGWWIMSMSAVDFGVKCLLVSNKLPASEQRTSEQVSDGQTDRQTDGQMVGDWWNAMLLSGSVHFCIRKPIKLQITILFHCNAVMTNE